MTGQKCAAVRPSTGHRYRTLIHELNQRYRREFDRAERLQTELDNIRGSLAWRLLNGLRILKRSVTGGRNEAQPNPTPQFCAPIDTPAMVQTAKVSIIIPFRDQVRLLDGCLSSLPRGTYRRLQIILVDNGSREQRTFRYLQNFAGRRGWHIVRSAGPFNFSHLCNKGARRATGDYLLFLNNDTEVVSPDWLQQMLAVGQHPRVGVVGATLLYPDRTIQHAGLAARDGAWTHLYRGRHFADPGDHGELRRVRQVPAVTGACLMIRRNLFRHLGGFDERLPVTGNDVDLCRRVRELGYLVAVTPHARLLHFECLSRGYSAEARSA
jgi:GT2 family glycosyltransferase